MPHRGDSNQQSIFLRKLITRKLYIPDKIRNATRRTDQLSGRSQVFFLLFWISDLTHSATGAAKITSDGPVSFISVQRYVRYCCITCCLKPGVKNVYKKIGQKPSRCQIVNSQKISVFIMLSCWISPINGNLLSRPNGTQTLILCKLYITR